MPHHHHGGTTCFAIEMCADDHAANDEHTHHSHGSDDGACSLRQLYIVEMQSDHDGASIKQGTPHNGASLALHASIIDIVKGDIFSKEYAVSAASIPSLRLSVAQPLRAPPALL